MADPIPGQIQFTDEELEWFAESIAEQKAKLLEENIRRGWYIGRDGQRKYGIDPELDPNAPPTFSGVPQVQARIPETLGGTAYTPYGDVAPPLPPMPGRTAYTPYGDTGGTPSIAPPLPLMLGESAYAPYGDVTPPPPPPSPDFRSVIPGSTTSQTGIPGIEDLPGAFANLPKLASLDAGTAANAISSAIYGMTDRISDQPFSDFTTEKKVDTKGNIVPVTGLEIDEEEDLSALTPGGMSRAELDAQNAAARLKAKQLQKALEEKEAESRAKWNTVDTTETEKMLGNKEDAVNLLVNADLDRDVHGRKPGEIEAYSATVNRAREERTEREQRVEEAGGMAALTRQQLAKPGVEIQTTLPDGTVIKEDSDLDTITKRFPEVMVDDNGVMKDTSQIAAAAAADQMATDQAVTAGALEGLGGDVVVGDRPAPLGEQNQWDIPEDIRAKKPPMIFDSNGNLIPADQAGQLQTIIGEQAAQPGQIGALSTIARNQFSPIAGLGETTTFDPTILLDPGEVYRRQRLGDISDVPMGVMLNPQLQQNLMRGYGPAMGRFLLNQALATGQDVTGGAFGPYQDVPQAFEAFLETGQRLPTADYRTAYSGLSDYFRQLASPQDLAAESPVDLRWAGILGGEDDATLKNRVLQMSVAALGVPPGMGDRARGGLEKIYDVMVTRYGEVGGRAQFTNWVASAYPVPYKTIAQNQATKQSVINNALSAVDEKSADKVVKDVEIDPESLGGKAIAASQAAVPSVTALPSYVTESEENITDYMRQMREPLGQSAYGNMLDQTIPGKVYESTVTGQPLKVASPPDPTVTPIARAFPTQSQAAQAMAQQIAGQVGGEYVPGMITSDFVPTPEQLKQLAREQQGLKKQVVTGLSPGSGQITGTLKDVWEDIQGIKAPSWLKKGF